MRFFRSAMAITLAALSGCNTYETLTPQVDVGTSGSISSSPLTEADMQTAMRQNDHYPVPPEEVPGGGPVRRQSFAQAYANPPVQEDTLEPVESGAFASTPNDTLEAQASALQQGYNPAASQPLDQPVRDEAAPRRRALKPHRESAETVPPAAGSETQQATAAAPGPPQEPQQAALPPADPATLRFLPIIGAPESALRPLARHLAADAEAKGLKIQLSADQPGAYVLKGYLSAMQDGASINISYVWDVLDGAGNRVHRIQGQQAIPGKASDPWEAVPASIMQLIATRTIEDYAAFARQHRS
ncbi:hypothetical protein [Allorhizobium undicola]|uniref:hypothetical protein n=1 Tax=Allorhizobium undicola TaxID=78527 RepID=UPI000561E796|nr:hypothetical protein [Allorhizobium undicola]